jgi:hypothetical protein
MDTNEDKSPYGRGFIAACIVIGAILLCGGLLLISGPGSAGASKAGTAGSSVGDQSRLGSGSCDANQPVSCDGSSGDPAVPASTDPVGSVSGSGCGLPAGDQEIPVKAPAADGWEVNRRVVVPRSSAYGPAKQDADGFRRCFAHSPTGAVYATYNVVAAMADQHKTLATAGKLMLPGPATDALLRQLRKEAADAEDSTPTQIAGFRVLDASRDRATVSLALPVETAFMTATFTLVWHAGDWRLVPPPPGNALGAPYAQQRDLSGFVAWSGV